MGIIMFVIIGILGQTNKVEAALQSNGGTPLKANLNDWVYYTRQMQATGGTLGLTDTINDDLTSSNKNLDIHMQKNTEYGAVAILSASSYGNLEKIADGGTTTGNASGIVVKLNGEWTAAAASNTDVRAMKVGKARYWNNYAGGNGSNSKIGDAMAQTNGWHGSVGNAWMSHICASQERGTADCAFVRANGGSCFSFDGRSWYGEYWRSYTYSMCNYHGGEQKNGGTCHPGKNTNAWYGRAVVVVGSGV